MIINSLLPPVCIQSVIDGQWYIVTTDSKLGWVKVDRRYDWEELNSMWNKRTFNVTKKVQPKPIKANYKVEGSKGNVYKVLNDSVSGVVVALHLVGVEVKIVNILYQ